MSRRAGRAASAAALCGAAALAAWALPALAGAAPPRGFYGVSPQSSLEASDLARMGQGRVGTLRFHLDWSRVDAGADPLLPVVGRRYDWSGIDGLVAAAARHGIRLLPYVYGTPRYVAVQLDGYDCEGCHDYAPRSDAALAAWQQFLDQAVRRYGPGGSFWVEHPDLPAVPIRAWQIWNEENSPTYFRPKPSPPAYARLTAAAAEAIRAVDPRSKIVLGGMFGTPFEGRSPAIAAWRFLRKLYRIPGAAASFDGVAPHPYARTMRGVRAQVRLTRRAMRRAGDRATPLWVTEIGWGSAAGPRSLNLGPHGQAKRLRQSFRYFTRARRRLKVRTVIWYSWRDSAAGDPAACSWCPSSGLFEADALVPKPAWRRYVRFTGGT